MSLPEKEVILLGLVAEEPCHAYGLEDKIRVRRMTEWTEIGFSSVYRVLSRLEEKGWIAARLEQAGQGAARKVYEITAAGRAALAKGVLDYLSSIAPPKVPLQVGLANITEAPRERVLSCLALRIKTLEAMFEEVRLHGCRDIDMPETYKIRVRLLFDHIERHARAEHDFLVAALEQVSAAPDEHFSGIAPAVEVDES